MKSNKRLLIMFFAAATLFAQDKPKPKAPILSDAAKAQFWKAQSEFQQAQAQAQKATEEAQKKQVSLQAAVQELRNTCGGVFELRLDDKGDPACLEKTKPPVTK